jgi:hypothetical protein
MDSCETSGIEVSDHVREVTKMIETGTNIQRKTFVKTIDIIINIMYSINIRKDKEIQDEIQSI